MNFLKIQRSDSISPYPYEIYNLSNDSICIPLKANKDHMQLSHLVVIDGLIQLKVYSRGKLKGNVSTSRRKYSKSIKSCYSIENKGKDGTDGREKKLVIIYAISIYHRIGQKRGY